MKIPKELDELIDIGVIEQVLRPLQSGKEAQVFLVRHEGEVRIAKVYKDAQNRSFKHRSQYTEGRKVRNSDKIGQCKINRGLKKLRWKQPESGRSSGFTKIITGPVFAYQRHMTSLMVFLIMEFICTKGGRTSTAFG